MTGKFKCLETNSNPLVTVLETWKETFNPRRHSLLKKTYQSSITTRTFWVSSYKREITEYVIFTSQPTPVTVGTLMNIEACYISVNDALYKTKNCIEAITLTFKIHFTINYAYPKRSRSLWRLFEKGVFGMNDQPGKFQSWAQLFAGELNACFNNQYPLNCKTDLWHNYKR